MEHVKHLETNDRETRTHIFSMTDQIDQRNQKIEKLEHDLLEHQKKARLAFKQ